MTKQKLNLGIIFGGISPEHEVSIITAIQAIEATPDNYNVIPIYIDKQGGWHTGDHLTKLSTFQKQLPPIPALPFLSRVMISKLPSSSPVGEIYSKSPDSNSTFSSPAFMAG